MKIFAALLLAFATMAVHAQAPKPVPNVGVTSSRAFPESVTHLTPTEQSTLDRLRHTAQNDEDKQAIKEYIAKIEKNHPGYHWEDHGILSEKSGLAPNPTQ